MSKIKFAATVTASELRDNLKDSLSLVHGNEVLQIVHRGQPVRVLMTQEYYLNLIANLDSLSHEKPETKERETVANRMQKIKAKLDATDENNANRKRVRSA